MTTRTSPCEAGRWLMGPIRNMILLACSDMEKEGNMDRNLAWRYGILQRLTVFGNFKQYIQAVL